MKGFKKSSHEDPLTRQPVRINYTTHLGDYIAQMASRFAGIPFHRLNAEINQSLEGLSTLINVDCSYIYLYSPENACFEITHLWKKQSLQISAAQFPAMEGNLLKWWRREIDKNGFLNIEDIPKIFIEYDFYKLFNSFGFRSALNFPLTESTNEGRKVIGFVGLASLCREHFYSDEEINLFKIMGNIFSMAVSHGHAFQDVTETEKKFRIMADNNYNWEYWLGFDGEMEYVSPSCKWISGYSPEEFIHDPKLVEKIVVDADKEKWAKHLCRRHEDNQVQNIFFRIHHAKGYIRWIEHTCQPIIMGNGDSLGIRVSNRDVTDRMEAEAQLRKVKYSMEHANVAIYWINSDSTIFYVNRAVSKLTGYTKEELLTMAISDIDPIWTRDKWEKEGWEFLKRAKVATFESKNKRKDGTVSFIEVTTNYVKYEGTEFLIAFVHDITERKKLEDELQWTKHTIDDSYIPTLWIRSDASVFYANNAFSVLSGYTIPELLNIEVPDFDPLWTREYWNTVGLTKLKEQKVSKFESAMKKKDGTVIPTEVFASFWDFKGDEYLFAIVSDISQIKQARETMEYQLNFEKMLASLSNRFINIAMEEFDTEIALALEQIGNFTMVDQILMCLISEDGNAVSCRYKWRREGLNGPEDSWDSPLAQHPWFMKKLAKKENIFCSNILELPEEEELVKEWCLQNGIESFLVLPMVYRDSTIGALWFGSSEEKIDLQNRNRNYYSILSEMFINAIARNSAELKAKERELQLLQAAKLVSLGTLVSGVAHEINNPNHYIGINAGILEKVWEEILPTLKNQFMGPGKPRILNMPFEEARRRIPQVIEGITEGSQRIRKIVESLKDFSRQSVDQMDENVDINQVVLRAVEMAKHMLKKSTDNYSLALSGHALFLYGNGQQIEQVVLNLITNACQALENRQQHMVISTYRDNKKDCIVVEVKDEGAGIPEDVMPNIFDPFFTTKRNSDGTGLGLSISYNIMKNHKGDLAITSRPGRGTVARAIFPKSSEVDDID